MTRLTALIIQSRTDLEVHAYQSGGKHGAELRFPNGRVLVSTLAIYDAPETATARMDQVIETVRGINLVDSFAAGATT